MPIQDIKVFCRKLHYQFADTKYLYKALRHSSYVNEHLKDGLEDNERLEFLGDAVLNLVIGHALMRHFPELEEGELTRCRAHLVNESQLAAVARTLNLGDHLLLGKGEAKTHGRHKNSILADALEAVIAAVYLDGGFEAASQTIQFHFSELLTDAAAFPFDQDHKSRLQETIQGKRGKTPVYVLIAEGGPDHDKTFRVGVKIGGVSVEGEGKSKKLAEQDAARNALKLLENRSINDKAL